MTSTAPPQHLIDNAATRRQWVSDSVENLFASILSCMKAAQILYGAIKLARYAEADLAAWHKSNQAADGA